MIRVTLWLSFPIFLFMSFKPVNLQQLDNIYACPCNNGTLAELSEFTVNTLCGIDSSNCDKAYSGLKGLYSNFVLIVANKEFVETRRLINELSFCGIESIMIYPSRQTPTDLSSICPKDRNVVVFNVDRKISNVLQPYSHQQYCQATKNLNSSSLIHVLRSCPNTLWVNSENSCWQNSSIFGLRLHNLDFDLSETTEKRKYVYQKTLIMTSIPYSPFLNKNTSENGTVTYSGIIVEMLEKISKNLHFNYTIVEPYDGNAGMRLENGSWNGMIRMLMDVQVDVAAAPLTVSALRDTVVDFSSTFYFETIGIMIKVPDKNRDLWRMFKLFSLNIWLLILFGCFISTFMIYFLHKYSAIPTDCGLETYGSCFWYVFGCISNQGGEYDPGSWSAQNFMALFWVFVFTIISMYGGGLIATLTTAGVSLPFTNLQELSKFVERNEYKICLQGSTGFHQNILNSDLAEYKILKQWLKDHDGFAGTENNCVQKLLIDSKLAFFAELTRLEEIQKDHCITVPLIILEERLYPGYFAFALQKNSPLNTLISMEITDAVQFGLMDKWKELWFAKPKFCKIVQPTDVIHADMDPLTLVEIGGPFLLIIGGLVISVIAVVVERFYFKKDISHLSRSKKTKRVTFFEDSNVADRQVNDPFTVQLRKLSDAHASTYTDYCISNNATSSLLLTKSRQSVNSTSEIFPTFGSLESK